MEEKVDVADMFIGSGVGVLIGWSVVDCLENYSKIIIINKGHREANFDYWLIDLSDS